MKKIVTVLFLTLILFTAACAPKQYPVEEIKIGSYNIGDEIKSEVQNKVTLNLSGLLEGTYVEASIDGMPVDVNEDQQLSFTLDEVRDYKLNVALHADKYESAKLSWNLTALAHPIDLKIESESENLNFPEGTESFELNVSATRENASFNIEPKDLGEFIPNEEQEENGKTVGSLKLKLPQQGTEDYKITVTAENSETVSRTVTASVTPKLKIGMSLSNLSLSFSQEQKVELYPEIADAGINASVVKGDAKAELKDNIITITGGKKDSTIYVKGEASGYMPFEGYINISVLTPKKNENNQQIEKTVSTAAYDHILDGIFKETNKRRIENGLEPLERIKVVDTPAMIRAKETDTLWSHTRPDGRDCFSVYEDVGLKYSSMGENLFSATKYLEPERVVDEWMNSPAHKENILQPMFKGIGLGYYEGDTYNFWVQLFVG